jgi:hypothetical protein
MSALVFCCLVSLFFHPLALSSEVSLFGGGEIDTRGQGFSMIGVDMTHKMREGFSLSARLAPNYLTYKYKSGGQLIRAHSPGIYAVGGIKLSGEKTDLGLFGGVEYRYTNLTPDVRSAKVRGDSFAGLVQGELEHRLSHITHLNVFGSYSATDRFFYEKAKIKRQITNLNFSKPNTIHLGFEEFYGRNPDFRMVGGGLFFEIYNILRKLSFTLHAGYKHDSTFGSGAYGGVEFYKGF